ADMEPTESEVVPPSAGFFSTTATRAPSCAAWTAAAIPDPPPPTTTTSYSRSGAFFSLFIDGCFPFGPGEQQAAATLGRTRARARAQRRRCRLPHHHAARTCDPPAGAGSALPG